jgi:hypothetical protein
MPPRHCCARSMLRSCNVCIASLSKRSANARRAQPDPWPPSGRSPAVAGPPASALKRGRNARGSDGGHDIRSSEDGPAIGGAGAACAWRDCLRGFDDMEPPPGWVSLAVWGAPQPPIGATLAEAVMSASCIRDAVLCPEHTDAPEMLLKAKPDPRLNAAAGRGLNSPPIDLRPWVPRRTSRLRRAAPDRGPCSARSRAAGVPRADDQGMTESVLAGHLLIGTAWTGPAAAQLGQVTNYLLPTVGLLPRCSDQSSFY